jgi:hypothetical protein
MQRVANREHMRRRRASGTERGALGPLVTGELRLRKAADVLAVLDDQVAAVLGDEELSTAERARLIATLAGGGAARDRGLGPRRARRGRRVRPP